MPQPSVPDHKTCLHVFVSCLPVAAWSFHPVTPQSECSSQLTCGFLWSRDFHRVTTLAIAMVVLAVAVSVAPSSCALGCMGSTDSEMESLRCEQTTLQQQQQQNALTQMHIRSSEEDINTLVCGRCRRNKSCEIQKIYTNILNAFSLDPMEIIVGEK
uniref:uncharacterized protein LOC117247667 isoform X4 n=1 Tax=Epinephelus lanceolatus TaxID=310571 RepID=UPI00144780AF|nr:uncharacterized protein LOC117247667 isoform X4 [Epinephelus lanceolatus]